MFRNLFALGLIFLFTLREGRALTCLSCKQITHPRLCDVVSTCDPNEVCFTSTAESHDGVKVYNLGCTDRNQTHVGTGGGGSMPCSEWCSTNLCNVQMCGEPGYPAKRGPLCYGCQTRLVDEPCKLITSCAEDEVCQYVQERKFWELTYTSGCRQKQLCDVHNHHSNGAVIIGKRSEDPDDDMTLGNCLHCCDSDLCNIGCPATTSHQTTPAYTTTQKQTEAITKPDQVANDCHELLHMGLGTTSGIYTITLPLSHTKIQVYCDMDYDGGGWTVFQNRYDGHVDFYRNFSQYENGFGDLSGEFWLGLKYIHELSAMCDENLGIELEKADGTKGYEVFRNFSVASGPDYTLHLETGLGDVHRTLPFHSDSDFHTFDHDNFFSCAKESHTGWWCELIMATNLNGEYVHPVGNVSSINSNRGMFYYAFDGSHSLKASRMMLRRHSVMQC